MIARFQALIITPSISTQLASLLAGSDLKAVVMAPASAANETDGAAGVVAKGSFEVSAAGTVVEWPVPATLDYGGAVQLDSGLEAVDPTLAFNA